MFKKVDIECVSILCSLGDQGQKHPNACSKSTPPEASRGFFIKHQGLHKENTLNMIIFLLRLEVIGK